MAVVNSEMEAEVLRYLYFYFGPASVNQIVLEINPTDNPILPPPTTTQTREPANATVHIGFHDIFIEGEYLTVRSK